MTEYNDIISRTIEYGMYFLIGCKLCGEPISSRTHSYPLIFLFPLLQVSIPYYFADFIPSCSDTIYLLLSIVINFSFFLALFFHAEDLSRKMFLFFKSEHYLLNLINVLEIYICTTSIVFVIQTFSKLIPDFFVMDMPFSILTEFLKYMLQLFTSWFIYRFFPISIYCEDIHKHNRLSQLLIINLFLISCPLMVKEIYILSDTQNILIFSVTCFTLLFVNMITFYYNRIIIEQHQQLKTYNMYTPVIDNLIQQIRAKQHSYENVIQSISMLPATHTNYDTLVPAIHNYCSSLPSNTQDIQLLKMNLRLLSGFLITKKETAGKQGKTMHINVENTTIETLLPEYLLIEIVGILLDNAIEATPKGKNIFLTIDSTEGKFYMKTKNLGPFITRDIRRQFFKYGYTTKENQPDNHGLGLSRLNHIISTNNGYISLSNEVNEEQTYIVFELEI